MSEAGNLYKFGEHFLLTADPESLVIQGGVSHELVEIDPGQIEVVITSHQLEAGVYTTSGRFPQLGWTFRLTRSDEKDPKDFWADWELDCDDYTLDYDSQCLLAEAIIRKQKT